MSDNLPLFSFAIISDTHIRPSGESSSPWRTNLETNDRARWVVKMMDAHSLDFIVHLGDIVHPVPHLPTYGSASMVANEIMGGVSSRCYFVPGNHDIGDKINPMVPSYVINEDFIRDFKKYYGPTFYSFDHHGIHFIVINSIALNSGLEEEEIQRVWLETDLEAHKDKRKIMFSHYPPYLYKPDEPSNYDNLDMPARKWLLDLLKKYEVEAFFAGHVHQFGYKWHHETQIYNLFSTCFVRQDFSEMFRVEPADEFGRNDTAKLGYAIVDVYETGHKVQIHRSYGGTLEEGIILEKPKVIEETQPFSIQHAPLGVHLRHPVVEKTLMPFMGPMDEFGRKWSRNDYPVLALWEAGIRTLRLPFQDLLDPETNQRLHELYKIGHMFMFFSINPPDIELVIENKEIIEYLEVIIPWENVESLLPATIKLREETGVPVYVANIESSVHRKRKGAKFSHYISYGFHLGDIENLEMVLPKKGSVDGYVFQVNQHDNPLNSIQSLNKYSKENGFKTIANVWLAPEDPAEHLIDENYAANRAAEAVIAAFAYSNVEVFLDTFVDHDRGYFPRIGLYDRRVNPRRAGKLVKNLQAALNRYGSEVKVTEIMNEDLRQVLFESKETSYKITLPRIEGVDYKAQIGSTVIDLISGEINPRKPVPRHQILEFFSK